MTHREISYWREARKYAALLTVLRIQGHRRFLNILCNGPLLGLWITSRSLIPPESEVARRAQPNDGSSATCPGRARLRPSCGVNGAIERKEICSAIPLPPGCAGGSGSL